MTTTNRSRFCSDRGAASGSTILVFGLIAFVGLWSQGTLAPVAGSLPGGPQYQNEAGNDFANGFKRGYNRATTPDGSESGPQSVAGAEATTEGGS